VLLLKPSSLNDYQNIQANKGSIRIKNWCLQIRMRQENVYMVEYKRTEHCVCLYMKSFKPETPIPKYPYIYSKTCLI